MRLLFHRATRPRENASRGLAPDPAAEAEQRLLGLPPRLAADWPGLFLDAFERALKRYRCFRLYLDSCTGCGLCAEACHFFRGTEDPRNIPGDRLALAREVYRRHFTLAGKRSHSKKVPERLLLEWFVYFNQCSQCRRCALFCPQGIDVSLVTQACREILASVGLCSQPAARAAADCLRSGNSLGVGPDEWLARSARLEAWLKQATGRDIRCPVDEYGARCAFYGPGRGSCAPPGGFCRLCQGFSRGRSFLDNQHLRLGRRQPRPFRGLPERQADRAQGAGGCQGAKTQAGPVGGESGAGWWAGGKLAPGLGCDWGGEEQLETGRPLSILDWAERMLDKGAFVGLLQREANDRRNVLCHYPLPPGPVRRAGRIRARHLEIQLQLCR